MSLAHPLHLPGGLSGRRAMAILFSTALVSGVAVVAGTAPAGAIAVSTEAELRAAFSNAAETSIELQNDIILSTCAPGELVRTSATGLVVTGNGHTITQTCAGQRVMSVAGGGSFELVDVTITGGTLSEANAIAGGLFYDGGPAGALALRGATVTGNTATSTSGGAFGGGVFTAALGGTTVTDSTISNNTATGIAAALGGGLADAGGGTVFARSAISGNTATTTSGDASGGGALTQPGTFIDSTVSGNTATTGGGSVNGGGVIGANSVTGSTISGNTAMATGGAAQGGGLMSGGAVTVTSTTVTGNTASGDSGGSGGGIFSGPSLVYSTVVDNTAATGANVFSISATTSSFASVIALPRGGGANCELPVGMIANGQSFSDDSTCELTGTGDRQSAGAPGLGALGGNGGPTSTRLPVAASPLIDWIPAADCQADGASGITADQRGLPRPADGNDDGVSACDIGAVEVQPTPPPVPPIAPVPPIGGGATPTAVPATPVAATPRFTG